MKQNIKNFADIKLDFVYLKMKVRMKQTLKILPCVHDGNSHRVRNENLYSLNLCPENESSYKGKAHCTLIMTSEASADDRIQ